MSTRVEEANDAERTAQARRDEEAKNDRKARDKEAFAKFMAKSQATVKKDMASTHLRREGQAAQQKSKTNNALLAKQGIDGQQRFLAELSKQRQDAVEQKYQGRHEEEQIGERHRAAEGVDRQDIDQKLDRQSEDRMKVLSEERDEGRSELDRDAAPSDSDEPLGLNQFPPTPRRSEAVVSGASEAKGSDAPRLSPEVLQHIVKSIFAGVTKNGLGRCIINLGDDVLGGLQIDITTKRTDAKNVTLDCTFHTTDAATARLLSSGETQRQLTSALNKKEIKLAGGTATLTLQRLAVEGP